MDEAQVLSPPPKKSSALFGAVQYRSVPPSTSECHSVRQFIKRTPIGGLHSVNDVRHNAETMPASRRSRQPSEGDQRLPFPGEHAPVGTASTQALTNRRETAGVGPDPSREHNPEYPDAEGRCPIAPAEVAAGENPTLAAKDSRRQNGGRPGDQKSNIVAEAGPRPSGRRRRAGQAETMTAEQRTLRARLAAYRLHATHDPKETTKRAREAFASRFERQVDPDGVLAPAERARRAEAARHAYFTRLALRSSQARRRAVWQQPAVPSPNRPAPQQ